MKCPIKAFAVKGSEFIARLEAGVVLPNLIDRYLAEKNQKLKNWLLSRVDQELAIRIEPTWLTSWIFSADVWIDFNKICGFSSSLWLSLRSVLEMRHELWQHRRNLIYYDKNALQLDSFSLIGLFFHQMLAAFSLSEDVTGASDYAGINRYPGAKIEQYSSPSRLITLWYWAN